MRTPATKSRPKTPATFNELLGFGFGHRMALHEITDLGHRFKSPRNHVRCIECITPGAEDYDASDRPP